MVLQRVRDFWRDQCTIDGVQWFCGVALIIPCLVLLVVATWVAELVPDHQFEVEVALPSENREAAPGAGGGYVIRETLLAGFPISTLLAIFLWGPLYVYQICCVGPLCFVLEFLLNSMTSGADSLCAQVKALIIWFPAVALRGWRLLLLDVAKQLLPLWTTAGETFGALFEQEHLAGTREVLSGAASSGYWAVSDLIAAGYNVVADGPFGATSLPKFLWYLEVGGGAVCLCFLFDRVGNLCYHLPGLTPYKIRFPIPAHGRFVSEDFSLSDGCITCVLLLVYCCAYNVVSRCGTSSPTPSVLAVASSSRDEKAVSELHFVECNAFFNSDFVLVKRTYVFLSHGMQFIPGLWFLRKWLRLVIHVLFRHAVCSRDGVRSKFVKVARECTARIHANWILLPGQILQLCGRVASWLRSAFRVKNIVSGKIMPSFSSIVMFVPRWNDEGGPLKKGQNRPARVFDCVAEEENKGASSSPSSASPTKDRVAVSVGEGVDAHDDEHAAPTHTTDVVDHQEDLERPRCAGGASHLVAPVAAATVAFGSEGALAAAADADRAAARADHVEEGTETTEQPTNFVGGSESPSVRPHQQDANTQRAWFRVRNLNGGHFAFWAPFRRTEDPHRVMLSVHRVRIGLSMTSEAAPIPRSLIAVIDTDKCVAANDASDADDESKLNAGRTGVGEQDHHDFDLADDIDVFADAPLEYVHGGKIYSASTAPKHPNCNIDDGEGATTADNSFHEQHLPQSAGEGIGCHEQDTIMTAPELGAAAPQSYDYEATCGRHGRSSAPLIQSSGGEDLSSVIRSTNQVQAVWNLLFPSRHVDGVLPPDDLDGVDDLDGLEESEWDGSDIDEDEDADIYEDVAYDGFHSTVTDIDRVFLTGVRRRDPAVLFDDATAGGGGLQVDNKLCQATTAAQKLMEIFAQDQLFELLGEQSAEHTRRWQRYFADEAEGGKGLAFLLTCLGARNSVGRTSRFDAEAVLVKEAELDDFGVRDRNRRRAYLRDPVFWFPSSHSRHGFSWYSVGGLLAYESMPPPMLMLMLALWTPHDVFIKLFGYCRAGACGGVGTLLFDACGSFYLHVYGGPLVAAFSALRLRLETSTGSRMQAIRNTLNLPSALTRIHELQPSSAVKVGGGGAVATSLRHQGGDAPATDPSKASTPPGHSGNAPIEVDTREMETEEDDDAAPCDGTFSLHCLELIVSLARLSHFRQSLAVVRTIDGGRASVLSHGERAKGEQLEAAWLEVVDNLSFALQKTGTPPQDLWSATMGEVQCRAVAELSGLRYFQHFFLQEDNWFPGGTSGGENERKNHNYKVRMVVAGPIRIYSFVRLLFGLALYGPAAYLVDRTSVGVGRSIDVWWNYRGIWGADAKNHAAAEDLRADVADRGDARTADVVTNARLAVRDGACWGRRMQVALSLFVEVCRGIVFAYVSRHDCRAADLYDWDRRESAGAQRCVRGSFDGSGVFRLMDGSLRRGVMQWQHFGRSPKYGRKRHFVTAVELLCFFLIFRSAVRVIGFEFLYKRVFLAAWNSICGTTDFDVSAVVLMMVHCVTAADLAIVRLYCTRERTCSWTEPFTDAFARGKDTAASGFQRLKRAALWGRRQIFW
eukprot:CAMPEP_0178988910 /NCGR_PEP_ID=MMETSP0795-20121207/4062_1 /TAXON_ID=88552 /ORGANISM="Amoebophrya sp., Strain Ameob2" /LENGTH=1594 /DNA_ID=CAMNT_0020680215 /DNA_START=193 /DNA_END=4974 /DNA_ORIENTATION=+